MPENRSEDRLDASAEHAFYLDGPATKDCSNEITRAPGGAPPIVRPKLPRRMSAQELLWPWQQRTLMGLALLIVPAVALWPGPALAIGLVALAIPFLCIILLRGAALLHALSVPPHNLRLPVRPSGRDDELPSYAALVPLYREADTLPGLLAALAALDYPADRLDILLIVEEVDAETRSALAALSYPDNMRVVVVPDGAPRTKPRALNHALAMTDARYVVVFDAEDTPEPDQLRRAMATFQDDAAAPWSGDRAPLACLQACLNVDNRDASWLTRQFALEYTALFDLLLPTLQHLNLPVPLGGTSNHFVRAELVRAGSWDAFNVTEDADLGIRLARLNMRVGILRSTTWEEAPVSVATWLGQRTRWLKGWIQTYVVHMREPARLLRELGPYRFAGFQILMGGMILSALVHPWFYVWLAAVAIAGADAGQLEPGGHDDSGWLTSLGIVNLVAGYVSAMALAALAVSRRGWGRLAGHAILMPVYWLMISWAAYRAIAELRTAPHHWEKTQHAPRPG